MIQNKKVFSEELLTKMKENMPLSPSVWHKIMNPNCLLCMREKGRGLVGDWSKEKEMK